MSRDISPALIAALSAPEIEPFHAVEMLFDTAPVRLWTGLGDRIIDGETYQGAGSLLGVSGLEEASDLSARSANVTLSGVDASVISLALQEPYQGRKCRILFGLRDIDGFAELFAGSINTMDIRHDALSVTVEVTVDSKLVALNRARNRRYTHEDQQARYPGDTFFSFVTDFQDRAIPWGRP